MELLKFDAKKDAPKTAWNSFPSGVAEVDVWAGEGIVRYFDDGQRLHENGFFGHFMGEGQHEIVPDLFKDTRSSKEPSVKRPKQDSPTSTEPYSEEVQKWLALRCKDRFLRLGPEETLYLLERRAIEVYHNKSLLSIDELWTYFLRQFSPQKLLKDYAVYRRLRLEGWTPTSGIAFGVDYSGYQITNNVDSLELIAASRVLFNVRKALVIASLHVPVDCDVHEFSSVNALDVELSVQTTFFPERNRP